ncbi:hypothetical protein [Alkalihalobacillus sp. CinArs1]|uniref:hypothetical protein n=1 Tax=Alkalihalobacillus sp. CinArs1 TaxID=2995314 RepID=UPI0022DE3917|nr:hypothetical protein [Alkalihalobacillus sp. CinArs1]
MFKILFGFILASLVGIFLFEISQLLAAIVISGIMGLVIYKVTESKRPFPWNIIGITIYTVGIFIIAMFQSEITFIIIFVIIALFAVIAPSNE